MPPADVYKYFAPLGIAGIWLVCGTILKKGYNGRDTSMSLHAADSKKAFILFGVGLTLNAICFYIFAAKWLTPVYHLPTAFMYLFTFTIIGQLITAWVPDVKGIQRTVHTIAAYTFSSCMPLLLLFLVQSSYASAALKAVAAFAVVTMVILIASMSISKKVRSHHLVVQVVYASVFHLTLLVAAFAG